MQLHQPFNQTSAFGLGNEIHALINWTSQSVRAGLIAWEAFEESAGGNFKRYGYLVEHRGAHAVLSALVFLELVNADAYRSGKPRLRYV